MSLLYSKLLALHDPWLQNPSCLRSLTQSESLIAYRTVDFLFVSTETSAVELKAFIFLRIY